MGYVCDSVFECEGWKNNMYQIPIIKNKYLLRIAHGMLSCYHGTPFKFCPWCGKDVSFRFKDNPSPKNSDLTMSRKEGEMEIENCLISDCKYWDITMEGNCSKGQEPHPESCEIRLRIIEQQVKSNLPQTEDKVKC